MESTFHDGAGAAWADWLFMLGLRGIGLRLSDGSASMSTNPFADCDLIYAIVLIALATGPNGPADEGPMASHRYSDRPSS